MYFKYQFKRKPILESLAFAFSLSVFYGIAIEIAQQLFTTTRAADVLDVAANMAGAVLGVTSVVLITKIWFDKTV